ncbi:MAG: 23S rRNA (guanosine(2251)-2'-O)-methyltransferase RlmB [Micavibrio sp.]|nr:MAG: 23S rRNA (guanosine(2251)-2'-O)-methyltransferase RlmB [Micavibrio sp.]
MQKKRKTGKHGSGRKPEKTKRKIPASTTHDRNRSGILFGIHAAGAAILNTKRHIHAVYVTAQAEKQIRPFFDQAKQAGLTRPAPVTVDKAQLDKMLPEGAVHQGIAVQAQDLHTPPLDKFCEEMPKNGTIRENIFVMLDQVTDPHNIGAILRSAAVFGAKALIVQDRHTPEITGTLAKSASGAVEHVPILRETNLARALAQLKDQGFLCAGLDERGKITIAEMTADENLSSYHGIVLVMGAEGDGLRRLTAENCDILVRLPAHGKIESLNVSNATAVALYELVR